jgi:hypothetical protein
MVIGVDTTMEASIIIARMLVEVNIYENNRKHVVTFRILSSMQSTY